MPAVQDEGLSARFVTRAAAILAEPATAGMPLCMTPPDLASKADTASPLTRTGPNSAGGKNSGLRPASEEYFQLRKTGRGFVRGAGFRLPSINAYIVRSALRRTSR